jgi:hypothetical protein
MTRIGLISDTHMPGTLKELWPAALTFLEGSDYILHAGDLHTLDIVDRLTAIAPTYVARGNGDEGLDDSRLRNHWLLDFSGIKIGLIHQCPSPERKSTQTIHKKLLRHFDTLPDILIFGHTHYEVLIADHELLFINPGSAILPRNQSVRPGTLGEIIIDQGKVQVSLHQIVDTSTIPHPEISTMTYSPQTSQLPL